MVVAYCSTRQTYILPTKGDAFLNYFDFDADGFFEG